MTLTLRVYNHFAALSSLFIITALILGCLVWMDFDHDIFLVFGIYFALDAIPAIYLHIEYYLCNDGETYKINPNEIIYYKDGLEKRFNKSELERITIYMPPSLYQGSSLHFLSIESYHYARITTKGGEVLIITCLLAPKVEEAVSQLSGVPYERKKRLFSTLSLK